MQNHKQQFKGKKITIMGLGLLGRGLGYTKFFAECGADLIVTDLKTKEQLESSVKVLSKYKNIQFVLGEHRLEDFKNRDLIMKAAGVPLDSIYIKEAVKNNIPIEMDVSLFAKCAPEVVLIGVTGTRGKSMTTAIIYEILKQNEKFLKRNVFIGGNVRGVATLPLLKKVKKNLPAGRQGDILICELDSWQLQGFGDSKLSPHISVFTSFMPDHMNYYRNSMERYFEDKANIFKFQKENDVLIIRKGMKDSIKKSNTKGKMIVVDAKDVDKYNFIVPGKYQKENLACAVKVAEQFDIPISKIAKAIKNFKGLEGRLQYIKTIKGVKIYNDNNATTPEATIAGIEAISRTPGVREKRCVLICGGADKKLPLEDFVKVVNKYCKGIIMIPGTGTDKLKAISYKLKAQTIEVQDLNQAVKLALQLAKKNDIILFSPAFASFGQFNNEYERNDLFMKIIKKLK